LVLRWKLVEKQIHRLLASVASEFSIARLPSRPWLNARSREKISQFRQVESDVFEEV